MPGHREFAWSMTMKQGLIMNSEKGFSMVEVVTATVISAFALGGLVFSFQTSLEASKQSEDYGIAVTLLQFLNSELRAGARNPGTSNEGRFGDSKYTWKINYQITNKPQLYLVETTVSWKERGRVKQIQQQTYLYWELEGEQ